MTDILVELMYEELPSNAQSKLRQFFLQHWLPEIPIETSTANANPQPSKNNAKYKKILIGPRRVALLGFNLSTNDYEKIEIKKGPKTSANQQVIRGFIQKYQLQEKDLIEVDGYFQYQKTLTIIDWLSQILQHKDLYNQTMIWQAPINYYLNDNRLKDRSIQPTRKLIEEKISGQTGQWRAIRPLRQIMIAIDNKTMTGTIHAFGSDLVLSQTLSGHRFLGKNNFVLNQVSDYENLMANNAVLFNFLNPKELEQGILKPYGVTILPKDADFYYQQVLPLVESAFYLIGEIEDNFMTLPPEIIASTMKTHQKFIPLYHKNNLAKLSSKFLIIANNGGQEEKQKQIKLGYQRVLNARLSDAKFFYQEDKKHNLYYFREKLKNRLFFQDLGNMFDKTERIKTIALTYQKFFHAKLTDQGIANIKTAAELCKSDLACQVVQELPELQGIMGGIYATNMGYDAEIAFALKYHYDKNEYLSQSMAKLIVFADRLDTLIQFQQIGKMPKGSGDPFALRRAGLEIIDCLLDKKSYPVNLTIDVLTLDETVKEFLYERLRHRLLSDFSFALVALLMPSAKTLPLWEIHLRLKEIAKLDLTDIYAAHKRAVNIYDANFIAKQCQQPAMWDFTKTFKQFLKPNDFTDSDNNFYQSLNDLEDKITTALAVAKTDGRHFQHAVKSLISYKQAINQFFTHTLVNDKNLSLRLNRQLLVGKFLKICLLIGDFNN